MELGGKTILIDIEVIDAQLDYNILLGCSYMYAMKAVASSVFRTIIFPHNGKIVTIDQVCSAQICKDIYIDVKTKFVNTFIFLPNYLISVSF
jgi:hypothetical protein